MERYYRTNKKASKRSEKNRELYDEVYTIDDIEEYSNIEAVAPLEKTNEIDITKIKNMLKSREDYKRQREYQKILKTNLEKKEQIQEPRLNQTKSYDIKEELEKVNTRKKDSAYHTLDDTSYQILKQLKINKEREIKNGVEEPTNIKSKLDNTAVLRNLNDEQLSLNMFEDLASSGKTMTSAKTSITSLLEEAKKIDEKNQREKEEKKIDNSFYTSSLNMDSKDFEGLYDKSNFQMTTRSKIKFITIGICLLLFLLIIIMVIKFK